LVSDIFDYCHHSGVFRVWRYRRDINRYRKNIVFRIFDPLCGVFSHGPPFPTRHLKEQGYENREKGVGYVG